jgi:hypothetical protein
MAPLRNIMLPRSSAYCLCRSGRHKLNLHKMMVKFPKTIISPAKKKDGLAI